MPIPPDQLAAFAAGGGPPPGADEGDSEGEGEVQEGAGQFGALLTLLEQHAEDVMALTDEFDPEMLADPSQDLDDADKQALQEGVEGLDEALKSELQTSIGGVSIEQAREMATHLESEDIIDDAERLAGWLFRVGQLDLSGGEGEEEEESDEPEGDPEAIPEGDDDY